MLSEKRVERGGCAGGISRPGNPVVRAIASRTVRARTWQEERSIWIQKSVSENAGGNRWTNSFREEGSNIFVTIIGIIVGKGVFKQFSVVWKFFRLSHDGLVGDIFHVNWMILRLLYFAIRIICTILLFVKIMFRVLILSRKKKERAHFTD